MITDHFVNILSVYMWALAIGLDWFLVYWRLLDLHLVFIYFLCIYFVVCLLTMGKPGSGNHGSVWASPST